VRWSRVSPERLSVRRALAPGAMRGRCGARWDKHPHDKIARHHLAPARRGATTGSRRESSVQCPARACRAEAVRSHACVVLTRQWGETREAGNYTQEAGRKKRDRYSVGLASCLTPHLDLSRRSPYRVLGVRNLVVRSFFIYIFFSTLTYRPNVHSCKVEVATLSFKTLGSPYNLIILTHQASWKSSHPTRPTAPRKLGISPIGFILFTPWKEF
jgi:hypothetical protein